MKRNEVGSDVSKGKSMDVALRPSGVTVITVSHDGARLARRALVDAYDI